MFGIHCDVDFYKVEVNVNTVVFLGACAGESEESEEGK
jgi:hypothetical protein